MGAQKVMSGCAVSIAKLVALWIVCFGIIAVPCDLLTTDFKISLDNATESIFQAYAWVVFTAATVLSIAIFVIAKLYKDK